MREIIIHELTSTGFVCSECEHQTTEAVVYPTLKCLGQDGDVAWFDASITLTCPQCGYSSHYVSWNTGYILHLMDQMEVRIE